MKDKQKLLKGLKLFSRIKFNDQRGSLSEIHINKLNIDLKYCILSKSKKNVIRGFHFQKKKPISQLVTCIEGSILDVVVDIRKNSLTFGKFQSFVISEKNKLSLFMPKGFAHGYLTLSDQSTIIYLNSQKYIKQKDSGFIWNDKFINFNWKIKKPIISKKDKNLKSFKKVIG